MAIVESMLVVVVVPRQATIAPIDLDDPNAAFRPYPITVSGSRMDA
jgi:hypothetical protein